MGRDLLTFNVHEGILEAMVHGYRDGLLRTEEYNNLCQCDTLGDLKSQLQVTDYGNFLQSENSLTPHTIVDRAQEVLVKQFKELRHWSEAPLSVFLDFIAYEYMISNVLKLIIAKRSGRDHLELLTKCHPLGIFPEMPSLIAASDVREMFEVVLIDSPIGRFFSTDGGFERGLEELSVEYIRGMLLKEYYEQFYDFCYALAGETREVMCPILDAEADRMVLTFTINTLGMREITSTDRRKVFPSIGTLVDIHDDIADSESEEQLRDRLRRFTGLYELLDEGRSVETAGRKSLERRFVDTSVLMYNDAMTRQFQYGIFYAFVKLKELEINNLQWISDCVVQQMKHRVHDNVHHQPYPVGMKSFLSKLTGRFKTKRIPAAQCDCRDFVEAVPQAPSNEYLNGVVKERHFAGLPPSASPVESHQREVRVRSTVFDLRYRCGANGRCTCAGAPACRFPACFTFRPVTKGAEVQAERMTYEVDDAPTPSIRALVQLAKQERLTETVQGIQHLVSANMKAAAKGRRLDARLVVGGEPGETFSPSEAKTGVDSAQEGVNPLLTNEDLRNETISLYLWRAALLVNLRMDDKAVHSLLNLAGTLEPQHRTRLYGAAASWAALNDMEIIYYRGLLQKYQSFPEAERFAMERPLLLARVFEAVRSEDYFTEYCAHVVFSKEVTATVSRAQAANMHGDLTEDPMRSLVTPLAIPYYRFKVSDAFWQHFLSLLCMPPVPPPTEVELMKQTWDPVAELGLTPNHILDAVGRSMLLHHVVVFAHTREKEIESGAVAKRVDMIRRQGLEADRCDYEQVLDTRELGVAVARMRQLLVVVKSFEEAGAGQVAAGGGGGSLQGAAGGEQRRVPEMPATPQKKA